MSAAASSGSPPAPLSYLSPPDRALVSAALSRGPLGLNALLSASHAFLREPSSSGYRQGKHRVHVVFGNEACDVDSMVSSLVLAWYLQTLHPAATTGNVFIPMMNLRRPELKMRGESFFMFHLAGVDTEALVYKEDVDFSALASSHELAVILVDHNHLEAAQQALATHVVAIVDHHKDEKLYPRSEGNRIIEVLGSCTSLVADLILRHAPELLSEQHCEREISHGAHHAPPTPLAVITLLYHVLLLDTNDMSAETQKYRAKDEFVLERYRVLMQRLTYFELRRRRADISHLSTKDLLLKDTKYGENARYRHMVCSIPGGLGEMASRDADCLRHVEEAARAQNLRFVVLLTSYTDDKSVYHREITLCVPRDSSPPSGGVLSSADLFSALCAGFEAATKDLDVVADDNILPEPARARPHDSHVRIYQQRNVKSSRKQVAPLLEQITSKL